MPALLDPKLDVVFKLLFAAERSRALLVSLLEAVLRPERPIADVAVLNPEIVADALGDKSVVLDLLVRLDDGTLVDVEMQTLWHAGLAQRALYYWARMASGELRRGDDYASLRRTVLVLILAERAFEGVPFHGVFRVRERRTGVELSDVLEIHTLELPKRAEVELAHAVRHDGHDGHDGHDRHEVELDRWARFLTAKTEQELEELATMSEVMAQAKSILEELSREPSAQEAARQRERGLFAWHHSLHVARQEGEAEGEAKGKAEAILAVLAARGVAVPQAVEQRVRACRDLAQLEVWLRAAATATSADEL